MTDVPEASSCVDWRDSAAWCRGVSVVSARALVIARSAVVQFGTMVVSMAGLPMVFTSYYLLEMGLRKMAGANSGACAYGTLSTFGW
jgi:hypothetical protein